MNKKRILLFLFAILVSIIIYLVYNNVEENGKLLQVANMDIGKKVIIIDARSWCSRLRSTKQKWYIRG